MTVLSWEWQNSVSLYTGVSAMEIIHDKEKFWRRQKSVFQYQVETTKTVHNRNATQLTTAVFWFCLKRLKWRKLHPNNWTTTGQLFRFLVQDTSEMTYIYDRPPGDDGEVPWLRNTSSPRRLETISIRRSWLCQHTFGAWNVRSRPETTLERPWKSWN